MIESINHKVLQLYYEEGIGSKLPHDQLNKINRILDALDAVNTEEDVKALGSGIHKLSGKMRNFWAIKVTANYRIIFRFEAGDIYDIDYLDYH